MCTRPCSKHHSCIHSFKTHGRLGGWTCCSAVLTKCSRGRKCLCFLLHFMPPSKFLLSTLGTHLEELATPLLSALITSVFILTCTESCLCALIRGHLGSSTRWSQQPREGGGTTGPILWIVMVRKAKVTPTKWQCQDEHPNPQTAPSPGLRTTRPHCLTPGEGPSRLCSLQGSRVGPGLISPYQPRYLPPDRHSM